MNANQSINLVIAADDNYAMPLAATVRSVIDSLDESYGLNVFVLDGGVSERHKHRVLKSWSSPRVKAHWLCPDREPISDLQTCGYLSLTAYLRLFIAELLPASVTKAIYLDSDVIVRRNLAELWVTKCDDVACCAVPDLLTPFLNTREAIGRNTLCDRQLKFTIPIRNYRELGLPANASYFNSGVLLINVDHWRRHSLLSAALRCLREHHDHVHLGDQYALNILLSGQWRPLDLRWNQIGTIYDCQDASDFPFDSALLRSTLDDPWVVHYCWLAKPWVAPCNHPRQGDFFRALDRTRWKRWRPHRPYSTLGDRYEFERDRWNAWWSHDVVPYVQSVRQQLRQKRRQIKQSIRETISSLQKSAK